jgi:hypothetical protein
MPLMGAASITRASGRGWALEIETFWGPVKWHRVDRRVPLRAQKSKTDFLIEIKVNSSFYLRLAMPKKQRSQKSVAELSL